MPRTPNTCKQVLAKLKALENKDRLAGKAYFGINTNKALGLTMPEIRGVAKTVTKNHSLAENLWAAGIHESKLIASMLDHPKWVTEDQMERWSQGFDSWDIVDQTCGDLFDRSPYAHTKIFEWATREQEFVKRAAFSLIAYCTVHDKKRPDEEFLTYLPLIETHADDPRNFVKKAVNWALRQIGKRSVYLHPSALELAKKLAQSPNITAQWIGRDTKRELSSEKVRARLGLSIP